MGLLKFILALQNNDDEKKKDKLEQEMDLNKFSDYEKEQVRNGNYDIYNMENSEDVELDEEDYYHDDW